MSREEIQELMQLTITELSFVCAPHIKAQDAFGTQDGFTVIEPKSFGRGEFEYEPDENDILADLTMITDMCELLA